MQNKIQIEGVIPEDASYKANAATKTARSPEDHLAAFKLHQDAADAYNVAYGRADEAGDYDKAQDHFQAAAEHSGQAYAHHAAYVQKAQGKIPLTTGGGEAVVA